MSSFVLNMETPVCFILALVFLFLGFEIPDELFFSAHHVSAAINWPLVTVGVAFAAAGFYFWSQKIQRGEAGGEWLY